MSILSTQVLAIAIVVVCYQLAITFFLMLVKGLLDSEKEQEEFVRKVDAKKHELEKQVAYLQDITRSAENIIEALGLSEERIVGDKPGYYVCHVCKSNSNAEHDRDCIVGDIIGLYHNTIDEINHAHFGENG